MKDTHKIINDVSSDSIITQIWGQNKAYIFYELCRKVQQGTQFPIYVISNKKFGVRSLVRYLMENGLTASIEGKGPSGERVVEVTNPNNIELAISEQKHEIEFYFVNTKFLAIVNSAIFSKKNLDKGTRFLLEIFSQNEESKLKGVLADFGAGWGAISIVLKTTYPLLNITAYEKEKGSFLALKENSEKYDYRVENDDVLTHNFNNEFDYIVTNPPFHVTNIEKEKFVEVCKNALQENGKLYLVAGGYAIQGYRAAIQKLFGINFKEENKPGWCVFIVTK